MLRFTHPKGVGQQIPTTPSKPAPTPRNTPAAYSPGTNPKAECKAVRSTCSNAQLRPGGVLPAVRPGGALPAGLCTPPKQTRYSGTPPVSPNTPYSPPQAKVPAPPTEEERANLARAIERFYQGQRQAVINTEASMRRIMCNDCDRTLQHIQENARQPLAIGSWLKEQVLMA